MPPEPASESLPTLRGIDWLAALLAGIAGATDATGILAFGRYTAHMSGTTSQTVAHALSNMGPVALGILAILCFVAGAALCGFVAEAFAARAARRTLAGLLAVEGLLLALAATLLTAAPEPILALAPMAFAMGLQNATSSRLLGPTIRTTHVTGTLTDLGDALGALARRGLGRRAALTDVAVRKGLLFCAFAGGGALGGGGYVWVGLYSLFASAALLGLAAVALVRSGRAGMATRP
jgi:uncharacterized membrane protein YoaK (UPF0700 family)